MPSLTWNGPNIFLTSDKFGGRLVLHIYKPIHSKDTIGTAQATSTVRESWGMSDNFTGSLSRFINVLV